MKTNYLILIILCVVVLLSACKLDSSDAVDSGDDVKKNEEITYGGTYKPSTEGRIIGIEDSNTVILEITVEREGYKVGDKVRVKYDKYVECDINSSTGGEKEYLPKIGDIISISFWESEKDSKDGMDLIVVDVATKFVTEYSEVLYDESAAHMKIIEGKIVNIKDENVILLEITKERGGYSIGDNVEVEFEKYLEENNNTPVVPNVGDVVGIQFFGSEEGEELIVVDEVYKHIE